MFIHDQVKNELNEPFWNACVIYMCRHFLNEEDAYFTFMGV